MLLIPFVENAFKHGISIVEHPFIDISINLNEDRSTLEFIVINALGKAEDQNENGMSYKCEEKTGAFIS